MIPVKIPGTLVAVAPEPEGDRIRYTAIRGNTMQHRTLAATFIQTPLVPKTGKPGPYIIPRPTLRKGGGGDEAIPPGNANDPRSPTNPTFLAWTPANKLFAGLPDGTIANWSATMRPEPQHRDHKAPVKAWATCVATGHFATADDKGHLAIWSAKGGKPAMDSVLSTAITGLSFNPSGSRLVIADSTGWLVIWDVAAGKAIHRVKLSGGRIVKAMAFGPGDDIILLASGKTVEVWTIAELIRQ
jgi:hypothetical protein